MDNNISKWVAKNITGAEITDSTEGGKIIFIPANQDNKVLRYFKRYGVKMEYRANYTWLAVMLPNVITP